MNARAAVLWALVVASCGGGSGGDVEADETADTDDTADAGVDLEVANDTSDASEDTADTDAPDTDRDGEATEVSDIADGLEVVAPACGAPFVPVTEPVLRRGELAARFTWPLADGGRFDLAETWTGCDSVIVIPDDLVVSALDPTSLWESDADLAALVAASPDDAHYLFVSVQADGPATDAFIDAMQARVDAVVAALPTERAAHWRDRLHVARTPMATLAGWPAEALAGAFPNGFAIAPDQRLRGLGSFADVTRYDRALADAGAWPWRDDLAYAAHEARYLEADAARSRALGAEGATVIDVFRGETLAGVAETDVAIPQDVARFDTLEVEVTLACPDPDRVELGNCGAWDYLASLSLTGDDGALREVARFITPYHREAHWVVDATFALAWLAPGATQHLRWEFAPEWNPQPTATRLALRLSNRGRGVRPVSAVPLFAGGDFGPGYNDRAPIALPIPATTRRAEVWLLVTGHGAGQDQCAEFCDHHHLVAIGDAQHELSFPEVGDDDGCIARIERGMTPNQAGTWWLGRGGWCPGAAVEPWIIDATTEVVPGTDAVFDYRGLIGGGDPPANSGAIALSSYLVLFE